MKIKIQRWILVIAITLIVAFCYRDTLGNVVYEVRNLPAYLTLISLLFTAIYYMIDGKLMQFVASRYREDFSWSRGIAVAYISSFYKVITLGAAAGPAEVYYLHREDIPISRATGMCLVKYIIHKITIVIIGTISYFILSGQMKSILLSYRMYIMLGILIMFFFTLVMAAVCTSMNFANIVIKLLKKINIRKTGMQRKRNDLIESIVLLQDESRILLTDKKKIVWILILNLGKQTCYYLIPAILLCYRSNMDALTVIALMAVCNMLAGVLPAPSGIGSLEFVFLKLFQTLAKAEIVVSVILLYRFVTWMMPFVIGGIILAFQRKHRFME